MCVRNGLTAERDDRDAAARAALRRALARRFPGLRYRIAALSELSGAATDDALKAYVVNSGVPIFTRECGAAICAARAADAAAAAGAAAAPFAVSVGIDVDGRGVSRWTKQASIWTKN